MRVSRRHKVVLAIYTVTYVLVALLAFRTELILSAEDPLLPAITTILILILFSLYIIPLLLVVDDLSPVLCIMLLCTTTWLAVLIVIDPIEPGLYGWDPYDILNDLEVFRSFTGPISTFTAETAEQPLLFSFVLILQAITSISPITIAKYIPLLIVIIPILYFSTLNRMMSVKMALIASFGLASLRTFLQFEAKFIPEMLSVFLLFVLFAIIVIPINNWLRGIICAIIGIEISLAHHFTSAMATIIFSLWFITVLLTFTTRYTSVKESPIDRFLPSQREDSPPIWILLNTAIAIGISSIIVSSWTEEATQSYIQSVFDVFIHGVPATPTGGTVGGGGELGLSALQAFLSSIGGILMLVTLAGINAAVILSKYDNLSWETAWVGGGGILSILFVTVMTLGFIIPLHETRLLIFMVLLLLGVTVSAIERSRFLSYVIRYDRYMIAAIVMSFFVLTQLSALPPDVLLSYPETELVIGEGHNPVQVTGAAEWTGTYNRETGTQRRLPIVGWEGEVWTQVGGQYFESYYRFDGECGDGKLLVWRGDATRLGGAVPKEIATGPHNQVYNSGDVAISHCRGQTDYLSQA